jgi:hypothetical protein
MWPAALITAGAAAFGRLFIAGIVPSSLVTVVIWLTLRAHAFSAHVHNLTLGQLIPPDFSISNGGQVLLFLFVVTVVTAILQLFQIGVVRILEGYWGASHVAVAFFAAGVRLQRGRQSRAADVLRRAAKSASPAADQPAGDTLLPRLAEQAAERRAALRHDLRVQRASLTVAAYPPYETDLLPTRLGNALRSGERRAGERYGWSTVHAWRRLYPGLPEPLAVAYRSARDAVDTAAIFCLVFVIIAALTAAAFYRDPALWWVPVLCGLLAFVSYRGAVTTALLQGVIQHVAFDRNRFELLEALHFELPDTPGEENELAKKVSRFLANGTSPDSAMRYLHGVRYSHLRPEPEPERPTSA